ncbi:MULTISPECIES: hypothetical protein [Pseudomonas]|uniref:Uncharacterized protein n=2 Tax=Pseudomonas TaxID=286 RepID=A0A5E7GZK8_PSEFL|nr:MULTISPECIES: hypothetical protein [Pseudomonas]MBH3446858.1 hypothetical protein [Pseudomonas moraviensis]MCI9873626.1 hypothetical protein [Pseudomonas atacamensis]VVO57291.1 hypothetical protein PS847_00602 [Pseudomonas fluorescens]
MAAQLDEAEKQILGALLIDFSERQLDAQQLKKPYEGPKISDLISAICSGDDITRVDFDIALNDLVKQKLIKTGPWQPYENKPGAGFILVGGHSLKEYACLTELGYKSARQAPNRPAKSQRIVNNLHISGGQFTNLQLAAGEIITQKMQSNTGADSDILAKLIQILEKQGQVVSLEQQNELSVAIAHANEGNGKAAKTSLEKVCGSVWDSVQPVMWPILGELLKKSLGL